MYKNNKTKKKQNNFFMYVDLLYYRVKKKKKTKKNPCVLTLLFFDSVHIYVLILMKSDSTCFATFKTQKLSFECFDSKVGNHKIWII